MLRPEGVSDELDDTERGRPADVDWVEPAEGDFFGATVGDVCVSPATFRAFPGADVPADVPAAGGADVPEVRGAGELAGLAAGTSTA